LKKQADLRGPSGLGRLILADQGRSSATRLQGRENKPAKRIKLPDKTGVTGVTMMTLWVEFLRNAPLYKDPQQSKSLSKFENPC
jgi:hypothetical protein